MTRRVLVTGAGGFIGRHLVERLHRGGDEVVALGRSDVDLTDRGAFTAAVEAAAPDVAFHLAAARDRSDLDRRIATATVNAMTGLWLVEALPDSCGSVVRLGSSTEYAGQAAPMDERTPLRPRGFFGSTKAAGSLLLAAAAAERGLPAVVLRAFQVYGPRDKPDRFIPTVLAAARTGGELPLTGPGLRRDWVWVGDVVEACLVAARSGLSGTWNVGTGVQTTNEQVVALAAAVSQRTITIATAPHPGREWDCASWVCDPTAARRDLGWEPGVELRDGLRRCWEEAA